MENPKERVTIEEIKEHRFFLMGRDIYLKRYKLKNVKPFANLKNNFIERNYHLEDINSFINKDNKTIYSVRRTNEGIIKNNKRNDTYSNNVSLGDLKGDDYSLNFAKDRLLKSEDKKNSQSKIYKKDLSLNKNYLSLNNFPSIKKIYHSPLK